MKQPTHEDYELAAKAAGIELIWAQIRDGLPAPHHQPNKPFAEHWRPLHDDGDSRRLQVACGIDMFWWFDCVEASVLIEDTDDNMKSTISYNNDKCEAARHAVFWLAVEIGKGEA
jgi:hypothetical protein